jgi:DNA-binding response OmpR family regulator
MQGHEVRFLVVDDEPLARSLISRAFQSDGHACRTAESVGEAEQLMAAERIDGIVIDLEHQGEKGMSWLERVFYKRPSLTRKTVVATTGELTAADRRRIARMGAVLLLKPFSLETLRSVVLDLTARSGQPRRSA